MSCERAVTIGPSRRGLRWLGGALLGHFAFVCIVKFSGGKGAELLWISHVGLLLTGLGLILSSRLLWTTALTLVVVPHTLWIVDCVVGLATGDFPLDLTNYVTQAGPLEWLGTAHHFYLLPLLLALFLRDRVWPVEAWPLSIAVFLGLTVVSRGLTPPTDNVNWAFGVCPEWDTPAVSAINRLGGSVHLLLLNAFVAGMILTPTAWGLSRLAARSRGGGRGGSAGVQWERRSGRGGRSSGPSSADRAGGKSELGRARWLLTATRREPRESATENTPPV